MYKEDNKVSFVRVLLRILLFVLLFILVIKLITFLFNKKNNNNANDVMSANLIKLNNVGVNTVKDENFNINVGETKTITLKELVENKTLEEIKDEKNNTCSNDESYIEILKTETEYRVKSYLVCGNNKQDKYIYLDVNTKEEIQDRTQPTTDETTTTTVAPETTTTKTTTVAPTTKKTTVKTTKKVTTTSKVTTTTKPVRTTTTIPANKVKISFNTNGGNQLSEIIVDKDTTVTLPIPTRSGYTFYRWEDSSGRAYANTISTNHNIVLIAKWR